MTEKYYRKYLETSKCHGGICRVFCLTDPRADTERGVAGEKKVSLYFG